MTSEKVLDRRFRFLAGYVVLIFVVSLAADIRYPRAAAALFATFWHSESSYFIWRSLGFNLDPLKEYLPLVLVTGTVNLLVFWCAIFRNGTSLLDLPTFNRLFSPKRFPRFYGLAGRLGKWGLFMAGLVPEAWSIGFLVQRNQPIRFGVAILLLGNTAKLASWSLVCRFALPSVTWEWWIAAPTVIFIIVGGHFLARFVERLLPGNGDPSRLDGVKRLRSLR